MLATQDENHSLFKKKKKTKTYINKHKLVHISWKLTFPSQHELLQNIYIDIGLLKHQQEALVKMSQRH